MSDFDVAALVNWYLENRRDLPWRGNRVPYRIWISEIMLQQTRVETVIPYFKRFLEHFSDVHALAAAELDAVLKLWEGLGYYSRARKMHECANAVVKDWNGAFPKTAAELTKLPGIGTYTSAAIASIAFGEAIPVVDGNVLRVASRYWALTDDIAKPAARDAIARRLQPAIASSGDPSAFNQGMMELGATICTPRSPSCLICPLAGTCRALAQALVEELPVKSKRKAIPEYPVEVAWIEDDGRVLVQQRGSTGMLAGLWEFPGGRVDEEDVTTRLKRELGIEVEVDDEAVFSVTQTYSHFRIHVSLYRARLITGEPRAIEGLQDVRWVETVALDQLAFGLAARKVIGRITGETGSREAPKG